MHYDENQMHYDRNQELAIYILQTFKVNKQNYSLLGNTGYSNMESR